MRRQRDVRFIKYCAGESAETPVPNVPDIRKRAAAPSPWQQPAGGDTAARFLMSVCRTSPLTENGCCKAACRVIIQWTCLILSGKTAGSAARRHDLCRKRTIPFLPWLPAIVCPSVRGKGAAHPPGPAALRLPHCFAAKGHKTKAGPAFRFCRRAGAFSAFRFSAPLPCPCSTSS